MTAGISGVSVTDPLATLREYAALAPWSLRDLTAVAAAILDTSGVFPVNAAARARPSERTIRFYVARRLVSPPEGRGTAAIYGYRHLLQVLAIKLRQMEGSTLDALIKEFAGVAGDAIERRVAGALGTRLPPPDRLALTPGGAPRGKVGRALQAWVDPVPATPPTGADEAHGGAARIWRRFSLGTGAELLVDERHHLFRLDRSEAELAGAFRRVVAELVPEGSGQ